jgi:hypothetical protein
MHIKQICRNLQNRLYKSGNHDAGQAAPNHCGCHVKGIRFK